MKQRESRTIPGAELRIAPAAGGLRTIAGYASLFNSPSRDLGGFTEVIMAGAFTKTLQESPRVPLLRDHRSEQVLANTAAGTLELAEDQRGLWFSATVDPTITYVNDALRSIERGDLDGTSFSFTATKDSWSANHTRRSVHECRLYECTITSMPAYSETTTTLHARSDDPKRRLSRRKLWAATLALYGRPNREI